MSPRVNRREFVLSGAAAVAAAPCARPTRRDARRRRPRPGAGACRPGRPSGRSWSRPATATSTRTADPMTGVVKAFRMITGGARRARRRHRGRQPLRARPGRDQRRLRRPAERRRRRAAGLVLHARAEEARRRRGVPRGRAHAVAGREGRHGAHRPPPAGRQGRPGLRAPPGLHDRGRPQHRDVAEALARMEAADRAGALSSIPIKRSAGRPTRRRSRWCARASSSSTTSGAPSTATALGPKGEICGVTTTSGMAWKIPGRVGDSPILGAGLYVDNEVGAAGSTGRGEANLYGLCSFLVVEDMRRGHVAQGRRHGGAQAHPGQHRSRSGCSTRRATRASRSTSTS